MLTTPEEANGLASWIAWMDGEFEASSGGPLRFEVGGNAELSQLVLAAYAQPLAALGLAEGPVAPRIPCRSCALLRPDAAWRAQDEGDWTRLEDLPEPLRERLVPDPERCDRCRPFRPAAGIADERPSVHVLTAFITPWEDGALAAYGDGTLRKLVPGRAAEPVCRPSGAFLPRAGYRATDTVFWVVDVVNHVHRLELDRLDPARGCEEALTFSSSVAWAGPELWSIDGPPSAEPEALWGVGGEYAFIDPVSTFSRFTLPGTTQILGQFDGSDNELGVAWAAPDRVVAVNGSLTIMRYEQGAARHERVMVEHTELRITGVAFHPSRGLLLGSNNNLVVVERANGKFEYLHTSGLSERVERVLDYRGGLVIGHRNGVFRQYYDDVGYCPPEKGFGNEALDHMIVTEGGALLGGSGRLFFHLPTPDECAP